MVATATGRVTMLRAGLPGGGMNPSPDSASPGEQVLAGNGSHLRPEITANDSSLARPRVGY